MEANRKPRDTYILMVINDLHINSETDVLYCAVSDPMVIT